MTLPAKGFRPRMAFSIATSLLVLSVATIQSAEPPTLSRVLPSAASLVRMAQAVPGIGDEDRVAITTFTNISGAPEDEWIGDGIVETLRADLTGIMHVLIVESRGRGTVEPTEGSGLVRARWVIRGGYQRLGDRVRITARVVEVVTSVVVQAARVDGAIGELFMLQDRLSAELRSGFPGPMKESDPDFLIVPPGGETGTGSARPAVAPPSEGMASLLNAFSATSGEPCRRSAAKGVRVFQNPQKASDRRTVPYEKPTGLKIPIPTCLPMEACEPGAVSWSPRRRGRRSRRRRTAWATSAWTTRLHPRFSAWAVAICASARSRRAAAWVLIEPPDGCGGERGPLLTRLTRAWGT